MKQKDLDNWWRDTDFETMEKITNYKVCEFSEEDGCQDFVDACDEFWNELSYSDKLYFYKMFN